MEEWVTLVILGVLVIYLVLRVAVLFHTVQLYTKGQKDPDQDRDACSPVCST